MSAQLTRLQKQIQTLSDEDRLELIRSLIEDLDGPAEADVEQAWLDEARRRQQELERGDVHAIPGDEVFAKARARLNR
jgi:putative addiction module component (TIGR02574 family)